MSSFFINRLLGFHQVTDLKSGGIFSGQLTVAKQQHLRWKNRSFGSVWQKTTKALKAATKVIHPLKIIQATYQNVIGKTCIELYKDNINLIKTKKDIRD